MSFSIGELDWKDESIASDAIGGDASGTDSSMSLRLRAAADAGDHIV